ncbi:hypothetical protein SAMN05920897_12315, partial [Alkalispirochaeta americana]
RLPCRTRQGRSDQRSPAKHDPSECEGHALPLPRENPGSVYNTPGITEVFYIREQICRSNGISGNL